MKTVYEHQYRYGENYPNRAVAGGLTDIVISLSMENNFRGKTEFRAAIAYRSDIIVAATRIIGFYNPLFLDTITCDRDLHTILNPTSESAYGEVTRVVGRYNGVKTTAAANQWQLIQWGRDNEVYELFYDFAKNRAETGQRPDQLILRLLDSLFSVEALAMNDYYARRAAGIKAEMPVPFEPGAKYDANATRDENEAAMKQRYVTMGMKFSAPAMAVETPKLEAPFRKEPAAGL